YSCIFIDLPVVLELSHVQSQQVYCGMQRAGKVMPHLSFSCREIEKMWQAFTPRKCKRLFTNDYRGA
ncbi:MAG: hypothetical protein ACRD4A_01250, partial [Candidatus Acidiferrales bacterium]